MEKTRRLTTDDLEQTARLFDRYRQFYLQPADLDASRNFIRERLENGDSYLIGAFEGAECVGIVQLYPSFSSVGLKKKLILNDMFVPEEHRRKGVAGELLRAAGALATTIGAGSMVLATRKDNTAARALYQASGWSEESNFVYYNFSPPNGA